VDALDILKWSPLGGCFADEDKRWIAQDDNDLHVMPSDMQLICDKCPVRSLCLDFAMRTEDPDGEAGYWGGTTPFQRQQLKRDRSRVKCPGCGSDAVVAEGRGEICLSCGISWTV
jgi:hypothetical protein